MNKEFVIRINDEILEPEDNPLTLRSSTPIFDRCSVPEKGSSTSNKRERNDVRLYQEWKSRLQKGKPRLFKVRGNRNRTATTNCSIISGHFESEVDGTPTPTPTPTPIYQMWFPFGYPAFWSPTHGCQHQNQIWSYGTAQIPHYQQIPSTFFGPPEWFFANFCQRTTEHRPVQLVQCDANYPANSYPHIHHWHQMHHHQFPTYATNPSHPNFFNRGTVIS